MGALRDGGRNTTPGRNPHRTCNALVMAQVAVAFVLVIGSVVISRSVKDPYWPDSSALGKRLTVAGMRTMVVGVAGNVHRLPSRFSAAAEPFRHRWNTGPRWPILLIGATAPCVGGR